MLMPPPPAPSLGRSFQTTSEVAAPSRDLQRSAATPQGVRRRGRKVDVLLAVGDAVGRTVVTRGNRHGDTGRGGLRQHLLHLSPGLLSPGVLGAAPADRDHARLVGGVVHRGRDGVDEALVGIGREVDDELRPRRDGAGYLDVEHHLAILVRIRTRGVRAAIDADRGHTRRGQPEAREVGVQIALAEPATELDEPHRLARAGHSGGKAVSRRDLERRVRRCVGRWYLGADVGLRLRTLIDPERAGDHSVQPPGDGQGSLPSAVGAGGRVLQQLEVLRAKGPRHRIDRSAQLHRPAPGIDLGHVKPILTSERLARRPHPRHSPRIPLLARSARDRSSLRKSATGFLVDPVERSRRPQIHRD